MRKIFLLIIALVYLAIASCEHTDNNGDLGGQWQLLSMITTTNGDTVADKTTGIYYSVRRQLMSIRGNGTYYLSTFSHQGDSLFILPHPGDVAAGKTNINFSFLDRAGVTADGGFHIDYLSSQRMILSNEKYLLYFRKY